jgi:cytosine/adenosine deaminase-related metal-dependent hydrolase
MIFRAKIVVTMDGLPIENGAVITSRERTAAVGRFPELRKEYAHEEIVDLGERALLPGLINAHCHLDYTCLRGRIPRQRSFTDWIRVINAEKAKLSPENYIAAINEGFAEAKRFGTTTIANLIAFPELVSRLDPPIRTWWFAELFDVRDPTRARHIIELAVEQLKSQEHWGLAPHAPFTASADLYRHSAEIASLLTTHLAESRDEMSMFRDGAGELYNFLKELGRDMTDCGQQTPLEQFIRSSRGIEGNRTYLFVHLNELRETDLDLLKSAVTTASIVHCPRSHDYFGHSPFEFRKLRALGLNVCLGTDSLASNRDLSLFAEMRAFEKEFPDVAPQEIVQMVTSNPARALRQENALGKIRAGFLADFVAIPFAKSDSIFEEIVAFDQKVNWMMLGGRIWPN